MTKITRARESGFCFGVRKAIEVTTKTLDENDGEKIYCKGQLIHNKSVTDELTDKGLVIVESLDEVDDNSTVIIRSHGEGKDFFDQAADKNLTVIDATCPFVKRIHNLVETAHQEGRNIVIVGDKNHPEVVGTNGWCGKKAHIVGSREDAEELDIDDIFLVTQTTITDEMLEDVSDALAGKNIEINNTICSSTRDRQKDCIELAKTSDIMVVIGDSNSSNSKKLYSLASSYCPHSYFVQNINNLPLKEVLKCNKIGVTAGASTPERIIEEVISRMSEITNDNISMNDIMEDIDKSLRLPRAGEIVKGTVIQVSDDQAIINLGCKKDGVLPKEEITLEEGQTLKDTFAEGDEIEAKVIKTDDGEGVILLSKKKLEVNEHWNEISEAFENGEHVTVKVSRVINGGVLGTYKDINGFIPISHLSDKFVENPADFLGQEMEVKILNVDRNKGRIKFSRKDVIKEEKEKKLEEIWENINEEDIVDGKVMRFTDYGAFVDIGGIDGLLHISQISWGKLKHPKEVLSIGDEIKVKVLSMDKENNKISLGLKQIIPEPWSDIDSKYQVGDVVNGKVVQIQKYGAFVELEPGLDGLVHISEIAHKRIENTYDELEEGQEVEAKIIKIEPDEKRISLSIKATLPEDEEPEEEEVPEEEAPVEEEVPEVAEEAEAPAEEEAPEAAEEEEKAEEE